MLHPCKYFTQQPQCTSHTYYFKEHPNKQKTISHCIFQ